MQETLIQTGLRVPRRHAADVAPNPGGDEWRARIPAASCRGFVADNLCRDCRSNPIVVALASFALLQETLKTDKYFGLKCEILIKNNKSQYLVNNGVQKQSNRR